MSLSWRIVGIAAAIAAAPLLARAQSADLNTSTPTKNDFRLRVVEPAEGATLAGPTVRVTVNNALPDDRGETGAEISKTAPVPRPDISVALDGREQGVLRDPQNVLTLENVPPGPHKLVVVAKNKSGEIVDRKELSFSVSESAAASAATGGTQFPAASAPTAGSAETTDRGTVPPSSSATSGTSSNDAYRSTAPASGTANETARRSDVNPSPDAPEASASSSPATSRETLPKTGTAYPAIALAGAALLATGAWLRRGA